MIKAKVGQIWRTLNNYKIVVTSTEEADYEGEVCIIYSDGYVFQTSGENDFSFHELIAEYPTWQEAVNSEYFKND